MTRYILELTDAALESIQDRNKRYATVVRCEILATKAKDARSKAAKAFKNPMWLQPKLAVCTVAERNIRTPIILSSEYP